jgi:hypothetical protein
MREFELEPGERVIREARKHWFLFAVGMLPYAALALMPFIIRPFLGLSPALAPYASAVSLASPLSRAAIGVWLLVVWTGAWGSFTRYFLNLWVLTDRRIVEIKQRGYFNRQVSSVLLNRVQDVTTDVVGVIPSMLGIGTIKVQSAGEDAEFRMSGIPSPERMREAILTWAAERSGARSGV